jgi:hypothetical protein
MKKILFNTAFLILFLFSGKSLFAHCDGLDGPVVQAAKKSLETGDINFTLIWINEEYSEEVANVFRKILNVRGFSSEAREIADNYFFETVVRLHRQGEGEPFTGLKPEGRNLGPAIPAADLAVEKNSAADLQAILQDSLINRLNELFERVMHTKNFSADDVEAGREFVESYVNFIHFAEKSYEMNTGHHTHSVDQHEF